MKLERQKRHGSEPVEIVKIPKATWMADETHWPGTWLNSTAEHSKGDHARIIQNIEGSGLAPFDCWLTRYQHMALRAEKQKVPTLFLHIINLVPFCFFIDFVNTFEAHLLYRCNAWDFDIVSNSWH